MTTRRRVLLPLALAPVAGWAVWKAGSPEPTHPSRSFHLPLDEASAPWRELARARPSTGVADPEFPPGVRALDGRSVTLRGFMVPLTEGARHGRFILAANPIGCTVCERPSPTTMVNVHLRAPIAETREPILVTGTLRLKPLEGLFYRLDRAEVVAG